MKKKRIIPYVPPEDRSKLHEGCDEKFYLFGVSNRWDWTIFVAGFCTGLLLMSIIVFIKNGC